MDQKRIGRFIAELRTELNLTQTELGERLGVSYKAVSKWENGICLPDASLYTEICNIFGITKDELFAGQRKEIDYKNKTKYILMILCLVSMVVCLFIPNFVSNELIVSSVIGIILIVVLGYFTSNIYKLTNISKDNKKLKTIIVGNYLLIVLIPILLVVFSLFKLPSIEIISLVVIFIIISSGVFFYNFPYNRYIGLRLPWTVRNESTWNVAHKVLGVISLPIGSLTFICALCFDTELFLTIGLLLWLLIPSVISGIHFYKLFYKLHE